MVLGFQRATQYKPQNANGKNMTIPLNISFKDLLQDKEKIMKLMNLIGDPSCLQKIMADKDKLPKLMEIIGSSSNIQNIMNDLKKMSQINALFSNNTCLKNILNDKNKMKELTKILSEMKGMQVFPAMTGVPKISDLPSIPKNISDRINKFLLGLNSSNRSMNEVINEYSQLAKEYNVDPSIQKNIDRLSLFFINVSNRSINEIMNEYPNMADGLPQMPQIFRELLADKTNRDYWKRFSPQYKQDQQQIVAEGGPQPQLQVPFPNIQSQIPGVQPSNLNNIGPNERFGGQYLAVEDRFGKD